MLKIGLKILSYPSLLLHFFNCTVLKRKSFWEIKNSGDIFKYTQQKKIKKGLFSANFFFYQALINLYFSFLRDLKVHKSGFDIFQYNWLAIGNFLKPIHNLQDCIGTGFHHFQEFGGILMHFPIFIQGFECGRFELIEI